MVILNKLILLVIVGAIISSLDSGTGPKEAINVIEETAQVIEEIDSLSN